MSAQTYEELQALVEFQRNERADFVEALEQEREYSARLARNCDEMAERLNRLEDHLRTLADYAGSVGHEELDTPPKDPFPVRKERKA